MRKLKMLSAMALAGILSGCFGGGLTQGNGAFTADGGTFNLLFMHINLSQDNGFETDADALSVAKRHVPAGATVTNVNHGPAHWLSYPFPLCLYFGWNNHIIGFSGAQIGGTTR